MKVSTRYSVLSYSLAFAPHDGLYANGQKHVRLPISLEECGLLSTPDSSSSSVLDSSFYTLLTSLIDDESGLGRIDLDSS